MYSLKLGNREERQNGWMAWIASASGWVHNLILFCLEMVDLSWREVHQCRPRH